MEVYKGGKKQGADNKLLWILKRQSFRLRHIIKLGKF